MQRTAGPAQHAVDFYTAQSAFSDPGDFAGRYVGLPKEVGQLAATVRHLMIHRMEEELFGCTHPPGRLHHDAESRYLDEILRLLLARDAAPLTQPREPGDRFVGVCRDFALLHCSFLRDAGVPARLRLGFADYFGSDGFRTDHTVVEYWDAARGRWLLADAELTDPRFAATRPEVDFDPMDVPRDRFLVSGEAWRRARAGEADPRTFGVRLPGGELAGEWFMANVVRLDLSALNKVEPLPWDVWGESMEVLSDDAMTDALRALCDRAAAVTGDTVPFDAARTLFTQEATLRTPPKVLSLTTYNGPVEVVLRRARASGPQGLSAAAPRGGTAGHDPERIV
ncbi:transglutaminase domain-containing protein [Streptomyces sp. NPDC058657]|uniref:transglutaminase domain-containing protein n=1 Tax=unclassified Streptomyces TaxID=2593676 RepID=UPI0036574CCB